MQVTSPSLHWMQRQLRRLFLVWVCQSCIQVFHKKPWFHLKLAYSSPWVWVYSHCIISFWRFLHTCYMRVCHFLLRQIWYYTFCQIRSKSSYLCFGRLLLEYWLRNNYWNSFWIWWFHCLLCFLNLKSYLKSLKT